MSDTQYRNHRSPLQVCDVSGHPNYGKMNWEQFNKKLDEYLLMRGMVSPTPYRARGVAARANRMKNRKELSQNNQVKSQRKKSIKKS